MNIQHQIDQQLFSAQLDGHEAKITYRFIDDNSVDFNHTFVPDAFRGHGVAAQLVNTAIAWADENSYTIHASCSYVQLRLKRMKRM